VVDLILIYNQQQFLPRNAMLAQYVLSSCVCVSVTDIQTHDDCTYQTSIALCGKNVDLPLLRQDSIRRKLNIFLHFHDINVFPITVLVTNASVTNYEHTLELNVHKDFLKLRVFIINSENNT